MADLKAIETYYRGYRFRSRLEARWAVFLDALGVQFEYEKDGYDLDGVWYLPDFWLPDQRVWLEVKGPAILSGDDAWEKAYRLAEASETFVYVFCGQFPEHPVGLTGLAFNPFERMVAPEDERPPRPVRWLQCLICGQWQIGNRLEYLRCGCIRRCWAGNADLIRANTTARQARFEHGERGR
ncbi:MAG: hypothetical protein IT306_14655 [Chloroflexi bacterium]|nr:hypothetical protein [Chloroflexota bacterium]